MVLVTPPRKKAFRRWKVVKSPWREEEAAICVAIREMLDLALLPHITIWTRMEVYNGRSDSIGIAQQIQLKREGMMKGWPDVQMFWEAPCGSYGLFLEVKIPGEKPDPHQLEVHEKLRAVGFWVEVVYSAEEAYNALKKYNVPSRDLTF
jgi:hypothetical protein